MAWAKLIIGAPVLERMLHLEEHGIHIRGANTEVRGGALVVTLRLAGDGLPDCEVVGIMRRLEDGREVLEKLEPLR